MSDSDSDEMSDSGEGLWLKHGPDGDSTIALKHTANNQHGKSAPVWVHRASGAKFERNSKQPAKDPKPSKRKPVRGFRKQWKQPTQALPKGRPWLVWNAAALCMTCMACTLHGMTNSFVAGSDGHPNGAFFKEGPSLKRIMDHERGPDHIASMELDAQLQPEIGPVLREALSELDDQLLKLMMSAYTIAKEDMALEKMVPLSELLHLVGTNLDKVGKHYQGPRAAREMIECLAAELRADHIEDLIATPVVGLMVDETTDKSTQEQLIIFTRLIKNGRSILRYAGLVDVDGTSSEALYDHVIDFFDSLGVSLAGKLAVFCADGASNMAGSKRGLGKLLTDRLNPYLIAFHCVAHRLQLGVGDAADKVPFFVDFESVLRALYTHFSLSSKRKDALWKAFEVCDIVAREVVKWGATRWLSRANSIESIWYGYQAILEYLLTNLTDCMCQMLWTKLTTYSIVMVVFFLHDILQKQKALATALQSDTINYTHVSGMIDATLRGIHKGYLSDQPTYGTVFAEFLQIVDSHVGTATSKQFLLFDKYRGDYSRADHDMAMSEVVKPFAQALHDSIKERFPPSTFLAALDVLERNMWPNHVCGSSDLEKAAHKAHLELWADEQFVVLLAYFSKAKHSDDGPVEPVVDEDVAQLEFKAFFFLS